MVFYEDDDESVTGLSDEEDNNVAPKVRVIALLDADSFEEQVWKRKLRPDLVNTVAPVIAVNHDSIILAVNYYARELGNDIPRAGGRRVVEEAKISYPDLVVIEAGTKEGMMDSDFPLRESDKIINCIKSYKRTLVRPELITIERSSRDEFYIDLTDLVSSRMNSEFRKEQPGALTVNGLALPFEDDVINLTSTTKEFISPKSNVEKKAVVMLARKSVIHGNTLKHRILRVYPGDIEPYHAKEAALVHGAVIVQKIMKIVRERTGYQLSAGVAHNKLLAKVVCHRNKPEGITILTDIGLEERLFKSIPFQELPGYAGTTGEKLVELYEQQGIRLRMMYDVQKLDSRQLERTFKLIGEINPEMKAKELIEKAKGICNDAVETRYWSASANQSMSFKGQHKVYTWPDFKERMEGFARVFVEDKIQYRHDKHRRLITNLSVKVELRRGNLADLGNNINNTMSLQEVPSVNAVYAFIQRYLRDLRNRGVPFGDIQRLSMTGSKLQRV